MGTTDTNGKTIEQARKDAQATANKLSASHGERVVTLGRLYHSARRFSYGIRFEVAGDLAPKVVDGSRIVSIKQFYPQ